MRLKVRSLWRAVKDDLRIDFVPQQLTSYGGLELFSRYFRRLEVAARLRRALAMIPSDYGSARLALLILALFYVGSRLATGVGCRSSNSPPSDAAGRRWRQGSPGLSIA